jgi:hypothetical protein
MRSRTQFRARDKIDLITAEAFREIGRRVFRYSGQRSRPRRRYHSFRRLLQKEAASN